MSGYSKTPEESETMNEPKVARDAGERGQGICRTCLEPIWDEGGTIGHRKRRDGWSDRIEQGGDSLVCFKAVEYRHVPLRGREAYIYDIALSRASADHDRRIKAEAWDEGYDFGYSDPYEHIFDRPEQNPYRGGSS